MVISQAAIVLLTLAYADQFNFPLKEEEIYRRLIKTFLSKKSLKKILVGLERMGLVKYKNQLWKLNNGKAQVKVRLERARYSQKKWLEVDELLKTVSWIPWIKGVAVTGSLAVNNVTVDGDIDLMMVVAPRRLWLSRVLVSLSSLWAGKRRTWQGSEANSWCFNLWLDENSLSLSHGKRNIYSAYEVCQARWILDRANVKKKFYQTNYWAKKILPNYFTSNYKNITGKSEVESSRYQSAPVLRFIGRKFLDLLNLLFFISQYLHMYPHMSRERVSLGVAYFHPRSTKAQIYNGWLSSLKQLRKIQPKVVLVTGVFDLFHQEHQNFLRKAKAEGDLLVVGVETDRRVRKNKGAGRPIDDQQKRLQQLQLFPVVDLAFILPEKFDTPQDHLTLLEKIRPQLLAVSSHTPHLREKQRLMRKIGGEVRVVHKQNPKISTTQILS